MEHNIRRFPSADDMTSTVTDTATVTHIRSKAAARAKNGAVQVILGARAARADQALRAAGREPVGRTGAAAPAHAPAHAAPLTGPDAGTRAVTEAQRPVLPAAPHTDDRTAVAAVAAVPGTVTPLVGAVERCAHGLTGQAGDPAHGV
ncbi:hypothetical protein [Streptomyces griseoruber]|uniref:Uncharacterized protein n=1 Tax=Streptomyces griseoruber TaxID=1943 RepID=A0A101T276_9ACTN|nr:hypothetical protein [Streptomyces griseoruber]KUN84412.1 hypothetical protein AQJ64_14800 [Streptomyces griseoruber]